jgi:HAD superfamily hydrolase (TIGR01549 family)
LEEASPEQLANVGAFIVDFDGTLYDPGHFVRRLILGGGPEERLSLREIRLVGAERKTRKEFAGCDYGGAEAYYGRFFAALERRARSFAPSGAAAAAELRQWYFSRYLPRMIRIVGRFYSPRPGAAELLRALEERRIPHAVYSDYPCVRERLEALGLDPGICGLLFGPEHFGAQKPAAGPFLAIAAALGCEPGRVLVIGDKDSTDGAGARAAGMLYRRVREGVFAELAGSLLRKAHQTPSTAP